jgi:hypothetical protein
VGQAHQVKETLEVHTAELDSALLLEVAALQLQEERVALTLKLETVERAVCGTEAIMLVAVAAGLIPLK